MLAQGLERVGLAGAAAFVVGLLVLASPVGAVSARSAAAAGAYPPVVFLLFDEFPAIDLQQADGRIDAQRFPNFARLAGGSTWFRNTTTLSSSTITAVPVILTGQPRKRQEPVYRNYPNNLFTLLGDRYRLVVHESETRLCPPSLCKQAKLPPKVDLENFYRGRATEFHRFVASLHAPRGGRPTLYYHHVLLPHAPWLFLPDGRSRAVASTNAPGRSGEHWWSDQLAIQAWQRHLLQVGYSDRLLGQFLRRLHAVGLWDKALVIVTADHGISFRGGDERRRPTRTNLADLGFTPLFVKVPGQRRARIVDSRHVTTLDILPTIAAVLGITIPWPVSGTSAFAGGAGSDTVDVSGVTASETDALAQRRASLARQVRLLGTHAWGPRFAGTGRYGRLVGTRVGARTVARAAGESATIDRVDTKFLRAYPKRPSLVPSPLTGTLEGVRPGTPVAVALNGRIAAVTVAYREPGRRPVRFSALVGEADFRAGRNRVRLFALSGPVARPKLREAGVSLSG